MADNLYIMSTEAKSGKSVISMGIMELLLRKYDRVAFFRPIITADPEKNETDSDIDLILTHFKLNLPYERAFGYTAEEAGRLISLGKNEQLLEGIITKYDSLHDNYDFVLCEGTDFVSSTAAFEFDINGEVSKNLGCPVFLVVNAFNKTDEETLRSIELALDSLEEQGCKTLATIINRPENNEGKALVKMLKKDGYSDDQLVYALPDDVFLSKPTVHEIAKKTGAEILSGEEQLNRHVYNITVAAMQLPNFLTRIERRSLIITPGDRHDVIVACLALASSKSAENIAGIMLTGGLHPEEPIWNLIKGFSTSLPILSVKENTFPAAVLVDNIHSKISSGDVEKISHALKIFEDNVNLEELTERIVKTKTDFVSARMFEYELLQKAKKNKKHIVLPEGEEDRILLAADILLKREVVDITLLGNEDSIRANIARLGLEMENVNIVDPSKSDKLDAYSQTYFELRKHKGATSDNARDTMCDETYFGTMMVYKGEADGMVSGAVHSTAETIRPSLQIIKTIPGLSIVSSVFFMCLNKVLVYGDCAVNPNPNAQQLAEIAISSAQTAKSFGVDPYVAMLSYSSGKSGGGEDVEKVRDATDIAIAMTKEHFPGLKIEGPMQYDAAVDPDTAKTKLPNSEVAGKATVFIFPDLNTGNNTYKAVQRSAGVVAIGPILQGLKKPVNDLSRGCSVPDVVNTIVITAIQAHKG